MPDHEANFWDRNHPNNMVIDAKNHSMRSLFDYPLVQRLLGERDDHKGRKHTLELTPAQLDMLWTIVVCWEPSDETTKTEMQVADRLLAKVGKLVNDD